MRSTALAIGLAGLVAASPAVAEEAAAGARSRFAADAEAAGDAAWERRAAGFEASGTVAPEGIGEAVAAYGSALELLPDRLDLRFKLIEALYYQGHFATQAGRERLRLFHRMTALAEEGVAQAERGGDRQLVAEAHFWAAISWGLWGLDASRLAAAVHDVAGRIRDHATAVVANEERFADGGGHRLLGRLHAATPRIPMFTGWIDRGEGIEQLRQALGISRRDPRNLLFLAEALLDHRPEAACEALGLLAEAAAREPAPDQVVEESETILAARDRLARERHPEACR